MSDKDLVEGVLLGNQKYFKELVDKYQSLVLNTCNSFLHNKSNAEDVTQEVFIEVFLSIHKFRGEAKLSSWLYRVASNKSLNFIRDNKKRQLVKSIEGFFSGDQKNNDNQIADISSQYSEIDDTDTDKIEILHKSINSLSKNQRIAFTLSKFENLPYTQISEILNLSLSSVEGLIHRAKLNVQKKILKFYKNK